MYGTEMRLMEGACLRMQNVDFSYREVIVRDGKGWKTAPLPKKLITLIKEQQWTKSQGRKRATCRCKRCSRCFDWSGP
jgi:site-specific recombinase XerC